MGWAGFDGGVGGEGGSHALRAQGSNGDAHGRCALRNGSPLANRLRMGQRPPEEKAPPKSTQIKHPNKAPNPSPSPLEGPGRQPGRRACPQPRFEASHCRAGTQSIPASSNAYKAQ